MASDIFISYSSTDRARALALADYLRSEGHSVWIDTESIGGAARWRKEIAQALTDCKVFLLLVSGASLASENVQKELTIAAEEHKHLLPIDIEKVALTVDFRYHLAGVQHIKIEEPEKIIDAITKLTFSTTDQKKEVLHDPNDKTIRVAVLPFDDLSPLHDNEWFADGMMDELISTLGGLKDLRVPSRTDVIYYKKHHPKIREIARDLGVRYLIEGAVRKGGEKIRINASLFDAYTNEQLWSDKYDGTFDDVFQFQELVSTSIADALRLKLTPVETKIVRERPTDNPEAYELYLKGQKSQRLLTREGYENAIRLYDEAIKLDTSFVAAHLNYSSVCVAYYRELSRNEQWLIQAEDHLHSVETLGHTTAMKYWIMGEIAWLRKDFHNAEVFLLEAVKLDPLFDAAYNILGNIFVEMGKLEKAVDVFQKAVNISPTHEHYFNLMVVLSHMNDAEHLKEVAQKAVAIMEEVVHYEPMNYVALCNFAYALHWAGQGTKALLIAEEFSNNKSLDGLMLFNLGNLYDEIGQSDKCIKLIERAVEKGFQNIEAFDDFRMKESRFQPRLDRIIQQLKEKIGIKAELKQT
ncbi:MAG TPA: TIR domain-containing protein [Candidatus Kapabacteria bacterium]|nr:TIR domain-containing protein [Candidatus Kapabacteria bacterium]